MKLSRSFLGLLVFAGCTRCSAKISTHISFVSRQSDSIANAIPRGGSVALTLDPKAVATVGLSCLLGHCILDIVKPGKVVQLYELDTNQEINSFYFSRIGGWGLTTVSSLLLQMHTKIPYTQAIGYSFLPIASLTLYQLLTDQYQKVSLFEIMIASTISSSLPHDKNIRRV